MCNDVFPHKTFSRNSNLVFLGAGNVCFSLKEVEVANFQHI